MKVQGHDVHVVSYHCAFIRGTVSFVKREGEISDGKSNSKTTRESHQRRRLL